MASRLVIEWTRSSVRVAVGDFPLGPRKLRTLAAVSLGGTVEPADALREGLKMIKRVPPAVIVVVPREQVITRVVKFPTIERTELLQMVELYAKGQLPYPREQTLMDFSILSQQEGFSTVAIVACQREVIDRQISLMRGAGLSPSLVTVSSWGVLGWYRHTVRPAAAKEPSLVVNVDETRTDLVLIAGDRIVSSRSVGQGAQDWEGVGDVPELVTMEVERSRAAIRKELPGTEVHSLILTGLGTLAQWKGPMAQRLGLPVEVVEARQSLGTFASSGMASAVSPVVVAGLACSDFRGLLNVSPPEVRGQVRHRREVRELVMVSILLAGVLVVGSALLGLKVSRQKQIEIQVERLLEAMTPTAKRVQEENRAVQTVNTLLEHRRQFAVTLTGVFRQTPATVTLEALMFERGRGEVTLRGDAASTQAVLEYMDTLEKLAGVGTVELKQSMPRSMPGGGERTSFELILRQRP